MKRKHKILISVLLVFFIVCSVLVYLNFDFLVMLKNGFSYSKSDLEQMKSKNEEETKEVLKTIGISSIRPLTTEETKELSDGNITEKDAIDLVLGKKTLDEIKNKDISEQNTDNKNEDLPSKPSENAPPGENNDKEQGKGDNTLSNNQSESKTSVDEANEEISELIGKMYVLKGQFEGELAGVESWTLSQYRALTKEQKKSTAAKMEIGNQALAKALSLEKSCDAQVEQILSQIKYLLEKTNQDTSLVNSIRSAYNNEKQLMKSYYISTYR